jgi:hypothetical protein
MKQVTILRRRYVDADATAPLCSSRQRQKHMRRFRYPNAVHGWIAMGPTVVNSNPVSSLWVQVFLSSIECIAVRPGMPSLS